MPPPRAVFVDVDDTLVRSFGGKRVPMDATVTAVRALAARGVQLFCWSSGGAEYAREVARELSLEACFAGFLPKPDAFLDDVRVRDWRAVEWHPSECHGRTAEELLALLPSW